MVIISESKKAGYRGYGKTQYRYAMTYVVITLIVLILLNIYCSITCQQLYYQGKRDSMIEKCLLISDEIATLDVLNNTSIATIVGQMESLKVTRLIVTDQSAKVLYDSANEALGHYSLLPEILTAIKGNDVCCWNYRDGTTNTRAATPVVYYGTIVGSVYMDEFETTQGAMIQSLQKTVLQITFLLEIVVMLFSFAFANTFSRRLNRIMTSMRIIQEGDYTHKVNMGGNDELTILGNEFNDLTERLQTSEQKRSRFVSDASHELKTPLTVILTNAELLREKSENTDQQRFSESIVTMSNQMRGLVDSMLHLARADSGYAEGERERLDFSAVLEQAVLPFEPLYFEAGLTLESTLQPGISVKGNADQLRRVAEILLDNALKYASPGGTVQVELESRGFQCCLRVASPGQMLTARQCRDIFKRFYRVDSTRSANRSYGLGLAIAERIVSDHRGKIWAEGRDGVNTFYVNLPTNEIKL